MMFMTKYPKTFHVPWSPGLQNDDRRFDHLDHLVGKEVVITEKLDGENTTMYRSAIHARSIDGRHHWTRDWVKGFHAERSWLIPHNWRICGENVYAHHSIKYEALTSWFYGFNIWEDNVALSWDDTLARFKDMSIEPVPTIWRGIYDEDVIRAIGDRPSAFGAEQAEGWVMRLTSPFHYDRFNESVAKWVRKGHVTTDQHWMHRNDIEINKLRAS